MAIKPKNVAEHTRSIFPSHGKLFNNEFSRDASSQIRAVMVQRHCLLRCEQHCTSRYENDVEKVLISKL